MKRMSGYLKPVLPGLVLAVCLSLAGNGAALLGPRYSGMAIDCISAGPGQVDIARAWSLAVKMAVCYLISFGLTYGLSALMLHISRTVVVKMRQDVFEKLMTLPANYMDTHPTGDIISRISYDIELLNTSLSTDVVSLCSSVITVIGALVMMLAISPPLILVFGITVPFTFRITRKRAKVVKPLFRRRSRKNGALNGFAEERLSGLETLHVYCQEENTVRQFAQVSQEAADAAYDAEYMAAMVGPSVNLMNNISITLVSMFGALLFLAGRMTLGNISSFILYSRKFSGPINESANMISEFQSYMAAAERIFTLLDETPETDVPDCQEAEIFDGEVAFDHVTFGYEPGKPVLEQFCFTACPGQTVAIVGPTGAGKTTIINLLMRFYDPWEGEIRIDGRSIRNMSRASLRRQFAMVLQESWLFYGTVRENIAYGRAGAGQAEVEQAARAAGIHEEIMKLPDGYDTVVTDDGQNLSQGQRQLLCIARAMLSGGKMLILDEATSNVDTRTEKLIQEAMGKLMEGKTAFLIAHRLSTVRDADHILVIQDGKIAEQGDHEMLMRAGGIYCRLYRSQWGMFPA